MCAHLKEEAPHNVFVQIPIAEPQRVDQRLEIAVRCEFHHNAQVLLLLLLLMWLLVSLLLLLSIVLVRLLPLLLLLNLRLDIGGRRRVHKRSVVPNHVRVRRHTLQQEHFGDGGALLRADAQRR